MNRPTLENLIILSVVWCNTWKNNKGQIHDSYLDEKSRKYLGINLSEYYDITIEDFAENFSGGDYKPLMPHEIMNNINLTAISIDKELRKQLKNYAKSKGKLFYALVNDIVKKFLEEEAKKIRCLDL